MYVSIALTVIYSRINLYLEVALSGMIWNSTFKTMLSIRVLNVYNRKRLWIINNSVYAYASHGKRECKCPDVRKQLQVWSEYSGCRVWSPLVDLTAWHKKSVLVIGPLHRTRLTVTDVWRADYSTKQTSWINRRYIWLPVSHNEGQNSISFQSCEPWVSWVASASFSSCRKILVEPPCCVGSLGGSPRVPYPYQVMLILT